MSPFGWIRTLAIACALAGLAAPAAAQPAQTSSDRVMALHDEARSLADRGQHREALERLARALALANPRTQPALAARIELRRSASLRALGDRAAAFRSAGQARALAERAGDAGLVVDSLVQASTLMNEGGDTARAAGLLEGALARAERIDDERRLIVVLEALARYRRAQGNAAESIALVSRAIDIADRIGDIDVAVRGRGARSAALLATGRFDEALADAERGYELSRGARPVIEAVGAFNLAQAHAHIWNLDRAAGLWNEAIDAYRRSGLTLGLGLTLRQRMDTVFALGDFDAAARDGEEALVLLESTGPFAVPGLLAGLALIDARRGRHDSARSYASRAAALPADRASSRFIHDELGLVGLFTGSPETAESHFRIAQDVARSMADPEYEWRALYGLGRAALMRGDAALGETRLTEAVAIIERMRRALPDAGLRAAFLSDRTMAHEALVESLAAQSSAPDDGFARRALEVAEMARGRSLADLLAEGDALPADPALQAVRATEVEYARRLSEVQLRVAQAASDRDRAIAVADLEAAERDFESLVTRLRREQPAYASLRYPDPWPADRIQAVLHDDEALIEFVTGEQAGFGWVVRRSGTTLFRIPPRAVLESAVRLINAVLAAGDQEALTASGRRLGELLFGSARGRLDGVRRVVIVPDGPLNRLPFAALRIHDERWLVEEFAIAMAPSATVMGELRGRPQRPQARAMAAFAATGPNSAATLVSGSQRIDLRPLAGAEQEVREAIRLLDAAVPSIGRTEAAVKALGGEAVRIVHFAAHAVADEVVPRRSGVLLDPGDGEDGWLQVHEIPQLTMPADLVVLATCRSHIGRSVRGEGLLGLSRAFMRAGARAVVATLWEVDDAETRLVMRTFYERLASGLRPDAALQLAQLHMIGRGGRSADPRSWAPFMVTGDVSLPLFDAKRSPASTALTPGTVAALLALVAIVMLLWRRRAALRASADVESAGR